MNRILGLILVIVIPVAAFLYLTSSERGISLLPSFGGEVKPLVSVGNIPVRVSVADTPEKRVQGLSGQKSLEATEGLLFIFDESDYHGIWMKDMLFPIDIIWVSDQLRVVHIERNVSPDTYPRVFEPSKPARYVIETNARYTESFGIVEGDIVDMPSEIIPEDLRD